ncbi:MAG: YdcF family protein [Oscillospiraceae bacterium]|nr:YdcF family protein [Oscillospiraceae bacterium]
MKRIVTLMAAIVLFTAILIGMQPRTTEYQIAEGNRINFGHLLSDLLDAYENDSAQVQDRLQFDLETIKAVSIRDYDVAKAIAEHWASVYLDPEYHLNVYHDDDMEPEITDSGIPDTSSHAFIVLGYELKDGEMTDELKGRCKAAAVAAKMYPNTILVCSGGATGSNNPEHHTEAGMMRKYLAEQCGVNPGRIFTDERAMTTAENAVNTLAILKSRGVRTMTIVTSSYHQRWGQVLYNAMSAVYGKQYGYTPEIVSNYCFSIEPENEAFRNDARIAIRQLASILHIPRQAMNL